MNAKQGINAEYMGISPLTKISPQNHPLSPSGMSAPPPSGPVLFLCLLSLIATVTAGDLEILLDLKTSLQKSNTDVFNSWNSQNSVCNFTGITCDSVGSVTGIELAYSELTGTVPFASLCKLQSLQKLSLGFNNLYGNVSDDLNKCVNLQYLDLGTNNFGRSAPEMSALSQLQYLYLNGSGFSGAFPWKSLENMTGLLSLSLGDNPFDPTPFPSEILKLTKLNWLYISNCSIQGEIPAGIGNLVELRNLELSDNNITGEIPAEISKLLNLWQLELYNNRLTGRIPVGFRNLTNLANFDASMNYLEGDLSEVSYLKNLVSVQLFSNNLSGDIPAEFGEFRRLVNISLYQNRFTGSLPPKIGSWTGFNFIDISENFLTGTIPPDMCKQGTMQELLLLQNNLTGEIPATYADCKTLRRFRVSKNSLTGSVPAGLWGLPNLNIIDIAMNQIEGRITPDIGNANALAQLFVSNNKLSGELPEELSKASALIAIDLSYNQFSGKIPAKFGDLNRLGSLQLHDNKFSGSIPASIGSCDSLSDLNLARNSLSGTIPSSIGSLPNLNALNLSENELSGKIPARLSSLRLSLLDLSNNRLSGLVPESLTTEAYNGSFAGNPGLCSSNVNSFRRCPAGSKNVRTLTVCVVLASVILLISLACFLHLKKGQKDCDDRSLREESWDVKSFHVMSFSEEQILDSIKQENLIGKGGSGNVYRVSLSNGLDLAVKHIWNTDSVGRKKVKSTTPMLRSGGGGRGKSNEFDAEVQTLSSIRHVNVVKLFCSITSEDSSLLVYEYLPNGSLWDRLHTCRKMELDWETRYEIALGSAKGLEYLHHGCERPVIHRDVKSSNILLDEFLKPRIADFGLAKIVQANGGKDSTHVIAGTHGYIAPEYGYTYKVNEKSDVYSFGVVLMELVTGKRPMEAEYGDNKDIVSWVCSKLNGKESVMRLVDSRIPEALKDDAIEVLRIAILCTARLPALRPTMRSVVQMLEEAEPCRLLNIVITKNGSAKETAKFHNSGVYSE